MKLRKLEQKDAIGMLSWMKDPTVNQYFRFNPAKVTLESAKKYIQNAQDTEKNLHLAIVDEEDSYLGTISLKEIDPVTRNAEYAISTCSQVHGTGVAYQATCEILRIAFEELNLHRIYLNVLTENERANRFYVKCGFIFEGTFREHVSISGELKSINWYSILSNEFNK